MICRCEECAVRGAACGDCVVSVVLGGPSTGIEVGAAERQALAALADAGLLPRLRHQPRRVPVGAGRGAVDQEWALAASG